MTVNPPDDPHRSATDEVPSSEPRCDVCGQPLDGADRFCTHCGAPLAAPTPAAKARVRARRWRRRRRVLGVLAFIAVVVALIVVVVASTASDDPPRRVAGAGRSTTTTTTLPPAGPYRVTDGVNIRAGPGSTYPALGLIETGNEVLVTCVIDGEQVSGPLGPTTKWVRIVTPYGPAYLTAQYVATGPDIGSPTIIPVCDSV